jgi:hypothetical protein
MYWIALAQKRDKWQNLVNTGYWSFGFYKTHEILLLPDDLSVSLDACWSMELVNQAVGQLPIFSPSLSFHGSTAIVSLGHPTVEVSTSDSDIPRSVGLLWTSHRPVVETSTWRHTSLTKERYLCPWRGSNPQYQPSCGCKATRPPGSALTYLEIMKVKLHLQNSCPYINLIKMLHTDYCLYFVHRHFTM